MDLGISSLLMRSKCCNSIFIVVVVNEGTESSVCELMDWVEEAITAGLILKQRQKTSQWRKASHYLFNFCVFKIECC